MPYRGPYRIARSILLLACPVSFLSDALALLALRLHADGRLDTAVSRVVGIHFDVDYSIKGY